MINKIEKLKEIADGINDAVNAEILLTEIWTDIGPYRDGQISDQTLQKLNKWMDFNDSE